MTKRKNAPQQTDGEREILEHDSVAFEAEGRLLQEIGERLVALPNIALVELIKNAFDADATKCTVLLSDDGTTLTVSDDGMGMTKNHFLQRWMKLATGHKVNEPVSPRFGRRRTGKKGIGRFAVRFLGAELTLKTVAYDPSREILTEVRAEFDWAELDQSPSLASTTIDYDVFEALPDATLGTSLEIKGLRHGLEFLSSKEFQTDVLKLVSPLQSLRRGRFAAKKHSNFEEDPGLNVVLPGEDGEATKDVGKEILERAWATLNIDVHRDNVRYEVRLQGVDRPRVFTKRTVQKMRSGLVADIRYFPRRQGVFSDTSVDGRAAWTWVRDNCGVAIVDHGFRIAPFGFKDDDWLSLNLDSAHNKRDWRSSISLANFPISDERRSRPGDNPALNIPSNFQLVGAVFVQSASESGDDLTVSMDREGFLKNEAYEQLVDIVRGGLEFLALIDKEHLARLAEQRAREAAARTREDFKAAIESIEASSTLARGDKNRLVQHYSSLTEKLDEVEEYNRKARRNLETMGLLGVVAGFMTHEAARILEGLEGVLSRLETLKNKDPSIAESVKRIEEGYAAFKGHVDYTTLFVESMHKGSTSTFKARAQVDRILARFGGLALERGLVVQNEISDNLRVTNIPIAAYSGIMLNLYTNALKAVLARQDVSDAPHIVFRGWAEDGRHNIIVLDKGVGIPAEIQGRIFDPLFTTTSNTGNPLGSGMGLGLSLVKDVVGQFKGRIVIAKPPSGFSTCFRVELPSEDERGKN